MYVEAIKFFLLTVSLTCVFDAVRCETPPNNNYNVPLLDFSTDPVSKSFFCSTPKCCPIALTFDDGPDGAAGGPTDAIINYLYDNDIPATFFITSDTWNNIQTNLVAQESVKNIVKYGFDVGTHTAQHKDLTLLSATDIKNEIAAVETALTTFMSPPRLSLFRAPYGMPYSNSSQAKMDFVSKIAADSGYFHVGWQINPNDWACENNVTCVTDPIFTAIDEGVWGIVLLHFVWENTANTLPSLIAGLRQRGCQLLTTEQFVQAKYGKSSAEMIDDFNLNSDGAIIASTIPVMIICTFCTLFLRFSQ